MDTKCVNKTQKYVDVDYVVAGKWFVCQNPGNKKLTQ